MKLRAAFSVLALALHQVSTAHGQYVVMSICEDGTGGTRIKWEGAITSREGLQTAAGSTASNARFGGPNPGGHATILTGAFRQWEPDASGLADFSGFSRIATPTSIVVDPGTPGNGGFTLVSGSPNNSFGIFRDNPTLGAGQELVYFSEEYTLGSPNEGNLLLSTSFDDLDLIDGATSTITWGPADNKQSYTIIVDRDSESCSPDCTLIEPAVRTCLVPPEPESSSKKSKRSSKSTSTTSTTWSPIEGIQVCVYVEPEKKKKRGKKSKQSKKEDQCTIEGPYYETRCIESADDLANNEEIVNCGCCSFVDLSGTRTCVETAGAVIE